MSVSPKDFPLVADVIRDMPPLAGWCCGYSEGDEGPYSVLSAHKTRSQADRWLAYWRRERPSAEVTWREADIGDFKAGEPPR